MTDEQLVRALNDLGLDEQSYRALVLLPLVRVAWADGAIQEPELLQIQQVVAERYPLDAAATRVLDGWLSHEPTESYFERAFELLTVLATRIRGLLVDEGDEDWVRLGESVAKAHGGFLGVFAISAEERVALAEIADKLDLEQGDEYCSTVDTLTLLAADALPSSPRVTRGVLSFLDAEGAEVQHPVDATGLTIGRHGDNDLTIRIDRGVSRHHCRIFERDGTFWLEDSSSARGTLVNGERVRERRLFGGEVIVVGDLELRFVASTEEG